MANSLRHKIPDIIEIYGKTYIIQLEEDLEKIHESHGYHHEHESIIAIDKNLDTDTAMQTLLHECFHAIFKRISINQGVDSQAEEIIVDSLSKWVVENFQVKPK